MAPAAGKPAPWLPQAHHSVDLDSGSETGCDALAFGRSRENLEPGNIGKRQPAAVDVDAAEFGAAVQGRKHLSRIEQPLRVEGAFQPLLLVEIDLRKHLRHQIALLDADAMLAGQHAADLDAEF